MASPLQLANYVQQQGEIGRQQGTRNRLASLASQAYGAPVQERRGLVQQAIQADPTAGFALGQSLEQDRGQQMGSLSQKARMLVGYAKAGNQQGVQALYPQLAAEAQQLGLGQGIPQQWDESFLPGIEQLAMMGGSQGNSILSTYIDDQGNRVAVHRDGSTQVLGGADLGASQQTLTVDINGTPTQVTFDKRSGRYTTATLGGGSSPGRPPADVYIDPTLPPEVQQQIRDAEASGRQVPSEMYFSQPQAGTPIIGRPKEDEAAAVERAKLAEQLAALPVELRMRVESALAQQAGEQDIKPTAAQTSADSEFGKEYIAFTQGGAADAARQISELRSAAQQLRGNGGLTGPVVGLIPRGVRDITNPSSADVQERVEQVVQRSLRAILGAQFTEKEGERLIARAYNPRQSEAVNAGRVERLAAQLEAAFQAKQAAAAYYEANGTLEGFQGRLPSISDFDVTDEGGPGIPGVSQAIDRAGSMIGTGGQSTGPAAPEQRGPQRARNPQTGEVLELRNGQWVPVNE